MRILEEVDSGEFLQWIAIKYSSRVINWHKAIALLIWMILTIKQTIFQGEKYYQSPSACPIFILSPFATVNLKFLLSDRDFSWADNSSVSSEGASNTRTTVDPRLKTATCTQHMNQVEGQNRWETRFIRHWYKNRRLAKFSGHWEDRTVFENRIVCKHTSSPAFTLRPFCP